MYEDKLLAECHKWLWNTYPFTRGLAWHVANERKVSLVEGSLLKAKGVLAGVPDYVFNFNGKTTYFEFKSAIGRLKNSQENVIESLINSGFEVYIIRDFDTFKNIIDAKIKCT
jgi:hypothetical protein